MTVFEQIKKRDGRIVEFDSSKITGAIAKAGKASGEFGEREARKLTMRVLTLAHELRLGSMPDVEEVQDIVERVLLDSPFYKTAKAYILYREQHAQIRNIATKASVDLVEHYIQKLDWKIKENSNMSYSLQGLNNYISSDITSEYWLNQIYPPEIRDAHRRVLNSSRHNVIFVRLDVIGLCRGSRNLAFQEYETKHGLRYEPQCPHRIGQERRSAADG